jgi:hypothetical protein
MASASWTALSCSVSRCGTHCPGVYLGTDNRNNGTDNRNNGTENRNNGTDHRNNGTDHRNNGTDHRNNGTDHRNNGTENRNNGTENRNNGLLGSLPGVFLGALLSLYTEHLVSAFEYAGGLTTLWAHPPHLPASGLHPSLRQLPSDYSRRCHSCTGRGAVLPHSHRDWDSRLPACTGLHLTCPILTGTGILACPILTGTGIPACPRAPDCT